MNMNMNIEQIVAEMRQKIASRPVRDEDDFSESEYLELYPDVGNAVAAGTFRSGHEHWIRSGRAEAGVGGSASPATLRVRPALSRKETACLH